MFWNDTLATTLLSIKLKSSTKCKGANENTVAPTVDSESVPALSIVGRRETCS